MYYGMVYYLSFSTILFGKISCKIRSFFNYYNLLDTRGNYRFKH